MLPLSPLLGTALVAIAALVAARLPRPSPVAHVLEWSTRASPLGWFLLGLLVGPGTGLIDRALLDACAPIIACAVGWVAARAGADLAVREPAEWSLTGVLESVAAVLVPATLLVAVAQWRLTPSPEEWKTLGPIVATLAAAVALTGTANPRRAATASIVLATAALVALLLLPHARSADLKRLAIWVASAVGGAILCAGLAARLARGHSPVLATIAALCLGAGIGMAGGSSPAVLCGLLGFALARWSTPHARLAAELERHESTVSAVLWTIAGAGISGPLVTVALAAALLALWPMGRRVVTGDPSADSTLGLALGMNFLLVAGSAGTVARAVPTIVALGLLLVRVIPLPRPSERLTSPARRVEVSV